MEEHDVGLRGALAPARLCLWLGFGLYWSLTKGYMNTEVFSFPDKGGSDGSLFFLYLAASCLAAVALLIVDMALGRLRSVPAWAPALCAAAGLLLLSGTEQAARVAGCLILSVGMTCLFALWLTALARHGSRTAVVVDVALGFLAGNVIAWLYTWAASPFNYVAFVIILFADTVLCDHVLKFPAAEKAADPEADLPKARRLAAALKLPSLTLVSFFAVSAISIVMSYVALFDRQVALESQIWIHLAGPTIGALLALCLYRTFTARINGAQIVIVFMATLILLVPLLQSAYVTAFKLLSSAAVEFLFVQACALAALAVQPRPREAAPVALVCWLALSLSTLFGGAVGYVCARTFQNETLFYGCLGTLFAYLLIMALAFVAAVTARRRGRPEQGTPESGQAEAAPAPIAQSDVQQRCDALAAEYDLTPREKEVLDLLAVGRSNSYIAESLFISPDTVKGHTRHVYRKLQVHSKQKLLDLVHQDGAVSS